MRSLPHSDEVERAVIGAILTGSKYAEQYIERVNPAWFYRTLHREAFLVAREKVQAGQEIDLTILYEALKPKLHELGGIGLLAAIADDPGFDVNEYTRMLHELYMRREIIKIMAEFQDKLMQGRSDPCHAANQAMKRLEEIRDDSEVPSLLGYTEYESLIELAARMDSDSGKRVYTGIAELDETIGGFQAGELILITGESGIGKAQPLHSLILTIKGWKRMGQICVGDVIATPDGGWAKVSAVFPRGKMDVFRVNFSDGSHAECSDDHLWAVRTSTMKSRKQAWIVSALSDFKHNLRLPSGKLKYQIPMSQAIQFPKRALCINPYLLGALIGDGNLKHGTPYFSNADLDVVSEVEALLPVSLKMRKCGIYDYRISRGKYGNLGPNPLAFLLSNLKLRVRSSEKFIPPEYKFASISQRISLLQGLLDTDGSANYRSASVEFSSISEQLVDDVQFLVESLGGQASKSSRVPQFTYKGKKKHGRRSYRLIISLPSGILPFRCKRKLSRYNAPTKYQPARTIISVESVGEKPVQCIKIESENGLYLTDHCIVTHNTIFARQIARTSCATGLHGAYISLEMLAPNLIRRDVARELGIPQRRLRNPKQLNREEIHSLLGLSSKFCRRCRILDGTLDLEEIIRATSKLRSQGDLEWVVVDYDELIGANGKDDLERQQKIAFEMKAMSMRLQIPVILISQLRKPLDAQDRNKPTLARLYGSGAKVKHASCVIYVDREWVRDFKGSETNAAIILLKHRDGRVGRHDIYFNIEKLSFYSLHEAEPKPPRDFKIDATGNHE